MEALMILVSGTVASAGLGLLYIALKNVILVSLEILDLCCGSRLGCGSLDEEPCVTVSLQKLSGAVCEERNLNGAF